MAETIDMSLQIVQTQIRVVYSDITQIAAEALVSSDDVHLSMAGGVAGALRMAAGELPRRDIAKCLLPKPIGSVLVTSAGNLRARYIFHALTVDFRASRPTVVLLSQLIQQVMGLVNALQIERVAVPLLGSGAGGVPTEEALSYIVQGVACYLAGHPTSAREVIIAVYDDETDDHTTTQRQFASLFEPLRQKILGWQASLGPLNTRIGLLRHLLDAAGDDQELRRSAEARLAADQQALGGLFECTAHIDVAVLNQELGARQSDLSPQQYERLHRRLTTLLKDLDQDEQELIDTQSATRKRLRALQKEQALKGIDTPPQTVLGIDDCSRQLEQLVQQIEDLRRRQDQAQRDLSELERKWRVTGAKHS